MKARGAALLGCAVVLAGCALAVGIPGWFVYDGWRARHAPVFLVSRQWVLTTPALAELAGAHRHTDSDWFAEMSRGPDAWSVTHRVTGDRGGVLVRVSVVREEGSWEVASAEYEMSDGWEALSVGDLP